MDLLDVRRSTSLPTLNGYTHVVAFQLFLPRQPRPLAIWIKWWSTGTRKRSGSWPTGGDAAGLLEIVFELGDYREKDVHMTQGINILARSKRIYIGNWARYLMEGIHNRLNIFFLGLYPLHRVTTDIQKIWWSFAHGTISACIFLGPSEISKTMIVYSILISSSSTKFRTWAKRLVSWDPRRRREWIK